MGDYTVAYRPVLLMREMLIARDHVYQEKSKHCTSISSVKYNQGIASLSADEGNTYLFSEESKRRVLLLRSKEDSDALLRAFRGDSTAGSSIISQAEKLLEMNDAYFDSKSLSIAGYVLEKLGRSFVEQRKRRSISLLDGLRHAQRKALRGNVVHLRPDSKSCTPDIVRCKGYLIRAPRG